MERRGVYQDAAESLLPGDPRLKVVDDIKRYAEKRRSFDMDFLEHVMSCFDRRGYMTAEHYGKLLNVYYAYYMDRMK